MFFMQAIMAYAAAFCYSQYPQHGGKIFATHLTLSLGQDCIAEVRRQAKEKDLERKFMRNGLI